MEERNENKEELKEKQEFEDWATMIIRILESRCPPCLNFLLP